ncbi:unnamed protein product [Linum trigynum]|uniref:Uncharacterized protein n=1 Tax=Linum trigynum TaxID=586398 RepID=A0AAV2EDB0_9ROSI
MQRSAAPLLFSSGEWRVATSDPQGYDWRDQRGNRRRDESFRLGSAIDLALSAGGGGEIGFAMKFDGGREKVCGEIWF